MIKVVFILRQANYNDELHYFSKAYAEVF